MLSLSQIVEIHEISPDVNGGIIRPPVFPLDRIMIDDKMFRISHLEKIPDKELFKFTIVRCND